MLKNFVSGPNFYDMLNLYAKDVHSFEKSIKEWAKNYGNNSIMFFDECSLMEFSEKVKNFGASVDPGEANGTIYQHLNGTKKMYTPNILLEWKNVGGEKCIMTRISTRTNQVLYVMSSSWNGTTLWYAY